MKADQLRKYIIEPVLKGLGLESKTATKLILGTACMESNCGEYINQLQNGPARGIYQMELATANDIIQNYLNNRKSLKDKVYSYYIDSLSLEENLRGNLYFATAMTRIHYLRKPGSIPTDLQGQADYWKKWYNTAQGAGTASEYIQKWNKYVGEF